MPQHKCVILSYGETSPPMGNFSVFPSSVFNGYFFLTVKKLIKNNLNIQFTLTKVLQWSFCPALLQKKTSPLPPFPSNVTCYENLNQADEKEMLGLVDYEGAKLRIILRPLQILSHTAALRRKQDARTPILQEIRTPT